MKVLQSPQQSGTAVKGTRHSEEQIIAILTQGGAGLAKADLGVSMESPRKRERDVELRERLRELAAKGIRFGYRRLTAMMVRPRGGVPYKISARSGVSPAATMSCFVLSPRNRRGLRAC